MCNGRRLKQRSQTTPLPRTEPQKFRITHPFHPLFGRELELFAFKDHITERRACFLDEERRSHEIPLSWTDMALQEPPAFAAGKSWFRVMDLLELARLIEALKR
jgi:hypothetical protein